MGESPFLSFDSTPPPSASGTSFSTSTSYTTGHPEYEGGNNSLADVLPVGNASRCRLGLINNPTYQHSSSFAWRGGHQERIKDEQEVLLTC